MEWSLDHFNKEFEFYITEVGGYTRESLTVFFEFHRYSLPLFLPNHFIAASDISDDPTFNNNDDIATLYVPISSLYGNTWLYKNDRSLGRPLPDRLARLFMAKTAEDLPPIPIDDLQNGSYLATDGNHRIYSAYLRGWTTIKAEICSSCTLDNK